MNEEDDYDEDLHESTVKCNYYSIDDFSTSKFNSEKSFSIFHLNIHSIELHIEELQIILEMLDFEFDFLCITESKLQQYTEPRVNIEIKGYQSPVGTPTDATKGGVLIYVKAGINYLPREDLTSEMYKSKELESYFIEVINPKETNHIIGVIYRHPCMNQNVFIDDYLKNLTEKLSSDNKKLFIAGDFNFNLLNVSTHDETFSFFETMMSNFLLPLITLPTKINSVNSTVIDNIFTNHFHPDMLSGNLTVSISDHLPSFIIVPKKNQNHLPTKHNIYTRTRKNVDYSKIYQEYSLIDWDNELEISKNDINYSIQKFMFKINSILDKYMPLKKVSQK